MRREQSHMKMGKSVSGQGNHKGQDPEVGKSSACWKKIKKVSEWNRVNKAENQAKEAGARS